MVEGFTVTEDQLDADGQLPAFAWPGGYPLIYHADGTKFAIKRAEWLCAKCATAYLTNADADPEDGPFGRWVGILTAHPLYEGPATECDQCAAEIETAYGDPDEAT